jgi:hypothetical protein
LLCKNLYFIKAQQRIREENERRKLEEDQKRVQEEQDKKLQVCFKSSQNKKILIFCFSGICEISRSHQTNIPK